MFGCEGKRGRVTCGKWVDQSSLNVLGTGTVMNTILPNILPRNFFVVVLTVNTSISFLIPGRVKIQYYVFIIEFHYQI